MRDFRVLRIVLILTWGALLIAGTGIWQQHMQTPGESGSVRRAWPGSRISRVAQVPNLLLFGHPHCPCTQSTLEELEQLLRVARSAGDPISARVVFVCPASERQDWKQARAPARASTIPGLAVLWDEEGELAQQFGARTSGHVLLYGVQGELQFEGGITPARGQVGDNPGQQVLQSLISNPRPQSNLATSSIVISTPIYGCPLFGGQLIASQDLQR